MPAELTRLLRAHRAQQAAVRLEAGNLWHDGDWVFTNLTGEPLQNISDYRRWKALLRDAAVRDARLHDARHTAATTLLLLGVSERAVIDIIGWSTAKMTLVYQHITDAVRKDVADKVGAFIWGDTVQTPESRAPMTDRPSKPYRAGSATVPHGGLNATMKPFRTVPDKPEQPKSNSPEGASADYN